MPSLATTPLPLLSFWSDAVRAYADLPSVIFEGAVLSYAELDRRTDALAARLLELGIQPGDRIGIVLERSLLVPIALLAVLKAGAAYVPLDHRIPADRRSCLLRDSAPHILLTQRSLQSALDFSADRTLLMDEMEAGAAAPQPLSQTACHEGPACIIYASGSSGPPRGVVFGRCALANLIARQADDSRNRTGWRTLQFSPLSSGVHFQEFFGTWATGGTVVMTDDASRLDPDHLLATIERERINRLFLPFTALNHLADAACRRNFPTHLREVITAGEQLRISPDLRTFFTALPDCVLHYHYGPPEAPVVTASKLHGPVSAWPAVPPIGMPLPGVDLMVLDERGVMVQPGEAGKLYIGGKVLADGYHNQPALTAERFVMIRNFRFFRTGDFVRSAPDGNLDLLGQFDSQVKVGNYRAEPNRNGAAFPAGNGAGSQSQESAVALRSREERIAAIWAETLGVAHVAPDGNFFDLGGDSLKGVEMLLAVEAEFGMQLPVATLYLYPTVAQLAVALDGVDEPGQRPSLVLVQEGGERAPLFYAPGATAGDTVLLGYSPHLTSLARLLGNEQPIYSLYQEYSGPKTNIENVAANLVRDLREFQPSGPYHLAGWSLGALVVFEMARQLAAEGKSVGALALFDAIGPGNPKKRNSSGGRTAALQEWWQLPLAGKFTRPAANIGGVARASITRVRRKLKRLSGEKPPENPWRRSLKLEKDYLSIPRFYPGHVTLFVSSATVAEAKDNEALADDSALGWGAVTHSAEVHTIPGDHYTMFDEPGLIEIVRIMRRQLEAARFAVCTKLVTLAFGASEMI